jgi:1-acyl-sn-glycerol-3-phosphate acyltransferase
MNPEWNPGCANPYYSPALYFLGKHFTANLFRVVWRRRVFGLENIPPAGTPVIFAANHRSLTDPNMAGSAVPYPLFYFAKEELFNVPLLGWYIRRVNAFPVRRTEHDVGALRQAAEILRKGGGLMLFPEGGRRLDPRRQWKAKAGVGMLACMTGARVIPVGIRNNDRLARLPRVTVRFGKPIFPPAASGREDYQKLADTVMDHIRELCQ